MTISEKFIEAEKKLNADISDALALKLHDPIINELLTKQNLSNWKKRLAEGDSLPTSLAIGFQLGKLYTESKSSLSIKHVSPDDLGVNAQEMYQIIIIDKNLTIRNIKYWYKVNLTNHLRLNIPITVSAPLVASKQSFKMFKLGAVDFDYKLASASDSGCLYRFTATLSPKENTKSIGFGIQYENGIELADFNNYFGGNSLLPTQKATTLCLIDAELFNDRDMQFFELAFDPNVGEFCSILDNDPDGISKITQSGKFLLNTEPWFRSPRTPKLKQEEWTSKLSEFPTEISQILNQDISPSQYSIYLNERKSPNPLLYSLIAFGFSGTVIDSKMQWQLNNFPKVVEDRLKKFHNFPQNNKGKYTIAKIRGGHFNPMSKPNFGYDKNTAVEANIEVDPGNSKWNVIAEGLLAEQIKNSETNDIITAKFKLLFDNMRDMEQSSSALQVMEIINTEKQAN